MELDRLLPAGPPIDPVDLLTADAPWADPPAGRPRVLANMIATVDGVAAIDGGSTALGGDGDTAMFGALRTVCDAVLAGTGTVAAEGYGRLARAPERRAARERIGRAADPLMVLVTRSGHVPFHAPLFECPEQPVAIFTTPGKLTVPAGIAAPVTVHELEDLSNAAALRVLREAHGVGALLCEGGPSLLRALVADGLLDDLFLTVDPSLAGGDDVTRILAGDTLDRRATATLHWVLRHRDELHLRYRLRA